MGKLWERYGQSALVIFVQHRAASLGRLHWIGARVRKPSASEGQDLLRGLDPCKTVSLGEDTDSFLNMMGGRNISINRKKV